MSSGRAVPLFRSQNGISSESALRSHCSPRGKPVGRGKPLRATSVSLRSASGVAEFRGIVACGPPRKTRVAVSQVDGASTSDSRQPFFTLYYLLLPWGSGAESGYTLQRFYPVLRWGTLERAHSRGELLSGLRGRGVPEAEGRATQRRLRAKGSVRSVTRRAEPASSAPPAVAGDGHAGRRRYGRSARAQLGVSRLTYHL